MPRLRSRVYDLDGSGELDLLMALRIGPITDDGVTDDDLRVGWGIHGERTLGEGHGDGRRPWGWWSFEAGEEPPEPRDEPVRLAGLGELTDAELVALREAADEARPRVGTAAERISGGGRDCPGAVSLDVRAVELWERVEAATVPQAAAPRPDSVLPG